MGSGEPGRWTTRWAAVLMVIVVMATSVQCSAGSSMGAWKRALADRDDAPATIVAIGESTTEGQGASSQDKRWLSLLTSRLADRYPTGGDPAGAGAAETYLPATYRVYAPDSPWGTPYSATGTVEPVYWGANLGYRAITLRDGATAAYTVTGSSVDLWYFACPRCGELTYRVDDGAAATVATDGTFDAGRRVQDISLGTPGDHTVTVTAPSGAAYLGGFSVFRGDRGAGLHVYDASYSGAEVSTYLADETQFVSSVASVEPDLVTIDLGGNDYFANTDPALMKGQLERLVDDLRSLPERPSVLVVIPYEPVKSEATGPAWSEYVAVLREVGSSGRDISLLDLSPPDAMGPVAQDTRGWYQSDGVHPTDAGHARFADLMYGALAD